MLAVAGVRVYVSCFSLLSFVLGKADAFVNTGVIHRALHSSEGSRGIVDFQNRHVCEGRVIAAFDHRIERRTVVMCSERERGGLLPAWKEATTAALAAIQIFATGAPALAALHESSTQGQTVGRSGIMMAQASIMTDSAAEIGAAQVREAQPSGPFEEAWAKTNTFYYDQTHKGNDWQAVKKRLQADIASGKKTETKAISEMLALLNDKYSRSIDPATYEMLSKYDLIGVGVMLSPNSAGQLAVASPPRPKSQAEAFGVKKGDLISSINGMDTAKMNSFDVIDFLAKYQGKTLTFEIQGPESGAGVRKVELDRTFPAVEDPVIYALKDQGLHKVGYARLRDFNSISTNTLKDALSSMKEGGADEYVLDLRGNSGGAFQSALGIAGLFMDSKPIAYVVDGTGSRAEFKTKTEALVPDAPLVVWVDSFSASASEVLAGALQDDCRAVLRGDRTFGKGLVQAVYGLSDGSGLILTVAQYETPRGSYIHGKGILPDIRGGLPLKLLSGTLDFDQEQFDAARERMKSCPPLQDSRVGFKGAAGAVSSAGL